MLRKCPKSQCAAHSRSPRIVRHGHYFRTSDSRYIQRFRCAHCRTSFSEATGRPCFGQNKRKVNHPLGQLLCSGVSMRRAARLLRIHRVTVARKLRFLAQQARQAWSKDLDQFKFLKGFQFDDLETFEHSKCKPLSVTLVVEPAGRKILGFEVSSMPAKGPLAEIARKRYGYRPDHRSKAIDTLFRRLKPLVAPRPLLVSDKNPKYPSPVRRHFPQARHVTFKGRRGCVVGQGELKRIGFDPLFSLNHTCAMFRANINRLFRRTWCTTKKVEALADHLAVYLQYHNTVLT